MTTPELTAALRVAIWHNDIDHTACLLDKLEARMGPAELADLLENILDEGPVATGQDARRAPVLVVCA